MRGSMSIQYVFGLILALMVILFVVLMLTVFRPRLEGLIQAIVDLVSFG